MSDTERLGRYHTTVRRVRALHRDASLRRSEGVFLAEGLHLALDALRASVSVELALVSPRLAQRPEGRDLLERIAERGLPCFETADTVLDGLQDAHTPQPVLFVVRRPETTLDACLKAAGEPPLIVVAHALQDPGNLGSMLRTADAAGAGAFIVSGESVDLYHPRVVRASMGSIFRVPAIVAPIETVLRRLSDAGIARVGADTAGQTPHDAWDYALPTAVFLGRESDGLPAELLASMDRTLRIPMREGVESLSVAAAAAVLLFEAARARRETSGDRDE